MKNVLTFFTSELMGFPLRIHVYLVLKKRACAIGVRLYRLKTGCHLSILDKLSAGIPQTVIIYQTVIHATLATLVDLQSRAD
jgi:hypothetical protein